jgi:hypothetical protein
MICSLKRPTGVEGRVGLRPWRSNLTCTRFVVSEIKLDAEQGAAPDRISARLQSGQ